VLELSPDESFLSQHLPSSASALYDHAKQAQKTHCLTPSGLDRAENAEAFDGHGPSSKDPFVNVGKAASGDRYSRRTKLNAFDEQRAGKESIPDAQLEKQV
jgi:hypothetical protein